MTYKVTVQCFTFKDPVFVVKYAHRLGSIMLAVTYFVANKAKTMTSLHEPIQSLCWIFMVPTWPIELLKSRRQHFPSGKVFQCYATLVA